MVKKYTIGVTPGAPAVGTNYMFADFLENGIVEFTIVDDIPITFDYDQDISEKKLTFTTISGFQAGSKVLINYTPFCAVPNPCVQP